MSEMSADLKVLLVDDHPFVREGIRSFLSDQPGFDVVGEACSAEEALELAAKQKPDLVLLDINMPGVNGIEIVGSLRKLLPSSKILILTVHNSREYVLHVARSGAHGYLLKEAPPEELLQAIKAINKVLDIPRADRSAVRDRARQIAQDAWAADAVRKAVDAVNSAVVAAVVAGSVAATAAS